MNGQVSPLTPFVQYAIYYHLSTVHVIPDQFICFTTAGAREKNWNSLYQQIASLAGSRTQITSVFIPDGKSEDEIWEILNLVLENISPRDTIYFDLTHSFRYLPRLVMIVLHYAQRILGCKIEGVFYGAMEVLGQPQTVLRIPEDQRIAPIYNLLPLVEILEWIVGVDRYKSTGDASIVTTLTTGAVKELNRKFSDLEEFSLTSTWKSMVQAMDEFSRAVQTCRGRELEASRARLMDGVNKAISSGRARPRFRILTPLLESLKAHRTKNLYVIQKSSLCLYPIASPPLRKKKQRPDLASRGLCIYPRSF